MAIRGLTFVRVSHHGTMYLRPSDIGQNFSIETNLSHQVGPYSTNQLVYDELALDISQG